MPDFVNTKSYTQVLQDLDIDRNLRICLGFGVSPSTGSAGRLVSVPRDKDKLLSHQGGDKPFAVSFHF